MIGLVRMSLVSCLLVALLGACAATGDSSALAPTIATDGEGPVITRSEAFHTSVGELRSVRIRNRYGDLRVRTADRPGLGLAIVEQRLDPELIAAEVAVRPSEGRIEVEVSYAETAPLAMARHGRIGRVDLIAYLPSDVALEAETDDGALQIRHRRGPIIASSASGAVQASGASDLEIRTESGAVLARRGPGQPIGRLEVVSNKGDVGVLLPARADFVLVAEGGAGVQAGPGWYPEDGVVIPANTLRWTRQFGKGGREVLVRSRYGITTIGAVADPGS